MSPMDWGIGVQTMPRYAYFVILGLAVLGLLLWQGEGIQDVMRDILSPSTTESPESETEAQRPLTPEERSAYIVAVNRALRERMVVYKGRLRIGGDLLGHPVLGVEYVPIPLISVQCDRFFGVQIKGPGGEGDEVGPASMSLTSLFSGDIDRALHKIVMEASDGQELLDEVCRMVIDELDRPSLQPRH